MVMCLHFSIEEEDMLGHTNAKSHLYNTSSELGVNSYTIMQHRHTPHTII